MLELEDVHALRGDALVLRGVSLHVGEGEVVALIGRNGMGKTTLLRSVIGLSKITRGRALLAGSDITGLPGYVVARRGVGVVPEGRGMFPTLTVRENLVMGLRSARGAAATIDRCFDQFPELKGRARDRAGNLSGGQQQQLAIVRALISRPRLLLIDEFSEGIQPNVVRSIATVIKELGDNGVSVLIVEQNARLALGIARRGYILEKGRIVVSGESGDLLQDDALLRQHLVL